MLKTVAPAKNELKGYFSILEQIAARLRTGGLPSSQASLLAMHLAEIDQESARFQALVADLQHPPTKTNGHGDDLQEQLVDIEVSAEHIKSHIEAMTKLLSKSIDTLDTDTE